MIHMPTGAPISFHAMVVFGLGKKLLFEYVLERCGHIPSEEFDEISTNEAYRWYAVTQFLQLL